MPDFKPSIIEANILNESGTPFIFEPDEKIPVILVDAFPDLGKTVALRFIEYVLENPDGVISLPTGKSPEHFIMWVRHILAHWQNGDIQNLLKEHGLNASRRPDMSQLRFVQIDEFYPMNPLQDNSFHHYVQHYYINGFGLDPEKALLIDGSRIGLKPNESLDNIWHEDGQVDLSLRYRHARNHIEERQQQVLMAVDAWCMDYEEKIRALGGIGFFLGGIGPDGHIAFNIRGTDHHSTTRLCPLNYETQAAAATDLGGIEVARKRLAITIGLETITFNPDCVAIIMAAGEAKAHVVAEAIEEPADVLHPATVLHGIPNARFYITSGASQKLTARNLRALSNKAKLNESEIEKILVNISNKNKTPLIDLDEEIINQHPEGKILTSKSDEPIKTLLETTHKHIIEKIEHGRDTNHNTRFLHTEPHHDDVMLGYFAHVVRHFRQATNTHHFATLTSGFTSVSNAFMAQRLRTLLQFIDTIDFKQMSEEGYFQNDNATARNRDVWQYLDGVAEKNQQTMDRGSSRRLLRDLCDVYETQDIYRIKAHVAELLDYLENQYPGKRDPEHIQKIKGMTREWEVECLWGYYGWNCENVHHLRLGFYTGDIFTPEPTIGRDVEPILRLLHETDPDIITVALDPEASGPDTHYKVLQAVAEALREYQTDTGRDDIRVWGYRNVWYRFDPSEANVYVPVSLCMFSVMDRAFMNAFLSQRNASFPSHEYEGPFCELAQQIQVQQYQTIKTALGRGWFYEHPSALIRATRGFVFLREMQLDEFYETCRSLKKSIEKA